MDFKDQIRVLGERFLKLKDQIATEEATKNALIMPFIQCLGYDVFNPLEVVPEFIADLGIKKGEKVDYAILKDGAPIILIECKHWAQKLDLHGNQILRYFNVTKAKFAILTNGIKYKFYTDLVETNIMDDKPFLEFDINEIKEQQMEELKKFHKSYFDVSNILSSASELKYTNELKTLIAAELKNPSEDFVRYFTKKVYPKVVNSNVLFQFTDFVKKSAHQVLSDMITDRLKSAITKEAEAASKIDNDTLEDIVDASIKEKLIETTSEEIEGFFIVKSILRQLVDPNRIFFRDTQSYFSIILDDSNRKAICRLYLNGTKKYVITFDNNKKELRNDIASLDDIYNLSAQLTATTETYLNMK